MVILLIRNGADPSLEDNEGQWVGKCKKEILSQRNVNPLTIQFLLQNMCLKLLKL